MSRSGRERAEVSSRCPPSQIDDQFHDVDNAKSGQSIMIIKLYFHLVTHRKKQMRVGRNLVTRVIQ